MLSLLWEALAAGTPARRVGAGIAFALILALPLALIVYLVRKA